MIAQSVKKSQQVLLYFLVSVTTIPIAVGATIVDSIQPTFIFIPLAGVNNDIEYIWKNDLDIKFALEQLTQVAANQNFNVVDFAPIWNSVSQYGAISQNTYTATQIKALFLDYAGTDIAIEVGVKTIPKFSKIVAQVSLKSSLSANSDILIATQVCESPPFVSTVEVTTLIERAIKDYNSECVQSFINKTLGKYKEKIGDQKIIDLAVEIDKYYKPSWDLHTEIKEYSQNNTVIASNRRLCEIIDLWLANRKYRNLTTNGVTPREKLIRKILVPQYQSLDKIGIELVNFLRTLQSSELIPQPNFTTPQITGRKIKIELN